MCFASSKGAPPPSGTWASPGPKGTSRLLAGGAAPTSVGGLPASAHHRLAEPPPSPVVSLFAPLPSLSCLVGGLSPTGGGPNPIAAQRLQGGASPGSRWPWLRSVAPAPTDGAEAGWRPGPESRPSSSSQPAHRGPGEGRSGASAPSSHARRTRQKAPGFQTKPSHSVACPTGRPTDPPPPPPRESLFGARCLPLQPQPTGSVSQERRRTVCKPLPAL